jgi:hypothetical protein
VNAVPDKLVQQQMNVDGWPAGAEKPMPEQYSEEDPFQVRGLEP